MKDMANAPMMWQGMPFRGEVPEALKKNDPRQPQEVWDTQVKVFDLSDEEQLQQYNQVLDKVAKNLYMISHEDIQWMPEEKNWKVLIRYIERHAELPNPNQLRL